MLSCLPDDDAITLLWESGSVTVIVVGDCDMLRSVSSSSKEKLLSKAELAPSACNEHAGT